MVTEQYPQRYRWDFIGLSTDDKPTPATSEKVVNGSTFYCSDTSKLYVFCDGTWYERKPLGGGGGGGGTEYTAGAGIDISSDDVISVDTDTIQPKLSPGANVSIDDNVISATDTTYISFTGTDGEAAGTSGLVPAPAATDADKFLKSDGTWSAAGGGGGPTVVQTVGTSQTDVMSQNATTGMVYGDPSTLQLIKIGSGANAGSRSSSQDGRIAIGKSATATGHASNIAIGNGVSVTSTSSKSIGIGGSTTKNDTIIIGGIGRNQDGDKNVVIGSLAEVGANYHESCVALGYHATCTRSGEVNVGAGSTTKGYNSTSYRVIGGVHDGQEAHDAVTVGQVNSVIDAINTALSTNIPHIGASA